MAFSAKVLADSTNGEDRLTTFELTFPRCILAEFNTHRMISKNAASSRAIPTEKLIQRVIGDPFVPEFRLNKKGMSAGEELEDVTWANQCWVQARDEAVSRAQMLHGLNIHKQYVNRLLEPWMWVTVIASATEWNNLFHLRCSPEAEPSFQRIANMAYDAMQESKPRKLEVGAFHLPLFDEMSDLSLVCNSSKLQPTEEWINQTCAKVSVGRCARVSYLTHDGVRDIQADIDLHDRLATSGHWSPFEHVAAAGNPGERSGNFTGFRQYRKTFENENVAEFTRKN